MKPTKEFKQSVLELVTTGNPDGCLVTGDFYELQYRGVIVRAWAVIFFKPVEVYIHNLSTTYYLGDFCFKLHSAVRNRVKQEEQRQMDEIQDSVLQQITNAKTDSLSIKPTIRTPRQRRSRRKAA